MSGEALFILIACMIGTPLCGWLAYRVGYVRGHFDGFTDGWSTGHRMAVEDWKR